MGADDLRVLVLAGDPLARAGVAALLAGRPGYSVVAQAVGGRDLPSIIEVYRPDALVWDLGWEPAPSLEQLADIPEDGPPVVVLLPNGDHVAEAWAAGARGMLSRDSEAPDLAATLTAVSQGLVVVDPRLAARLPPIRNRTPNALTEDLTPRERKVLSLIAEGLPNKSIADRLGISEHTVKFHVNAILGKLGAQSRTEAVTRATRLGLLLL